MRHIYKILDPYLYKLDLVMIKNNITEKFEDVTVTSFLASTAIICLVRALN